MSESTDYTSLKALVGSKFTVKAINGYTFKKWDNDEKKFLEVDVPTKGYPKKYSLATDKGILEVGTGQLGTMLEAALEGGAANLIHKTFAIESNGKSGIDVRYYFNLVKESAEQAGLGDL